MVPEVGELQLLICKGGLSYPFQRAVQAFKVGYAFL